MPEFSNYLENLTPIPTVDGTEILGASKDGEAGSLTAQQIADLVASSESIYELNVSESAGAIAIDCALKKQVKATCTSTVSGNISISISNSTNLAVLHISIPVTGSSRQLTFFSSSRMSRYNEVSSGDGWYQSTKILQISSIGTADLWEFSFVKIGSVFKLNYDGPARA